MDRRALLRPLPVLLLGGCVGAPGGGGNDDGDDSPTITERTLRDTGRCSNPETATVTASGARIRVTGCVTGPNGCAKASLGSATLDGDELEVVVTTERDAPPDTACTEALVYRGYEATVGIDGDAPATVRVVHDAPGGRRTVAETEIET